MARGRCEPALVTWKELPNYEGKEGTTWIIPGGKSDPAMRQGSHQPVSGAEKEHCSLQSEEAATMVIAHKGAVVTVARKVRLDNLKIGKSDR